MERKRRRLASLIAACTLALSLTASGAAARSYEDEIGERRGYNSDYIFATTRLVNEWDAHEAFKVPLIPVALVVDLVFLPAEALAGLFG
jgi:hypothetical protein